MEPSRENQQGSIESGAASWSSSCMNRMIETSTNSTPSGSIDIFWNNPRTSERAIPTPFQIPQPRVTLSNNSRLRSRDATEPKGASKNTALAEDKFASTTLVNSDIVITQETLLQVVSRPGAPDKEVGQLFAIRHRRHRASGGSSRSSIMSLTEKQLDILHALCGCSDVAFCIGNVKVQVRNSLEELYNISKVNFSTFFKNRGRSMFSAATNTKRVVERRDEPPRSSRGANHINNTSQKMHPDKSATEISIKPNSKRACTSSITPGATQGDSHSLDLPASPWQLVANSQISSQNPYSNFYSGSTLASSSFVLQPASAAAAAAAAQFTARYSSVSHPTTVFGGNTTASFAGPSPLATAYQGLATAPHALATATPPACINTSAHCSQPLPYSAAQYVTDPEFSTAPDNRGTNQYWSGQTQTTRSSYPPVSLSASQPAAASFHTPPLLNHPGGDSSSPFLVVPSSNPKLENMLSDIGLGQSEIDMILGSDAPYVMFPQMQHQQQQGQWGLEEQQQTQPILDQQPLVFMLQPSGSDEGRQAHVPKLQLMETDSGFNVLVPMEQSVEMTDTSQRPLPLHLEKSPFTEQPKVKSNPSYCKEVNVDSDLSKQHQQDRSLNIAGYYSGLKAAASLVDDGPVIPPYGPPADSKDDAHVPPQEYSNPEGFVVMLSKSDMDDIFNGSTQISLLQRQLEQYQQQNLIVNQHPVEFPGNENKCIEEVVDVEEKGKGGCVSVEGTSSFQIGNEEEYYGEGGDKEEVSWDLPNLEDIAILRRQILDTEISNQLTGLSIFESES